MNQVAQRRCGAIGFTKVGRPTIPPTDSTMFSRQRFELMDQEWGIIIEKLTSFENLEVDWDGNQAIPPDKLMIEMAQQLAVQLQGCAYPAPVRVVAGVNGTISFEYPGDPIEEIEVVTPTRAEVYEAGKLVRTILADV